MKPTALYTMAFIIGLVISPLVAYFCWGSVGPLTVNGTHDFDGIFPLYIFAGTWVAVLSWRLRPRLGAFVPDPRGTAPAPHNVGLAAAGVLLIMFALPFIALASGYVIPGQGFFGISFTTSGWGIVLANIFAAYIGGAISGAYIAYRRREAVWALLGPLAGAVICGTMFDIGLPWQGLVLSLFGPPVALGTARLLVRLRIDEPKVIPLALGPGVVGATADGCAVSRGRRSSRRHSRQRAPTSSSLVTVTRFAPRRRDDAATYRHAASSALHWQHPPGTATPRRQRRSPSPSDCAFARRLSERFRTLRASPGRLPSRRVLPFHWGSQLEPREHFRSLGAVGGSLSRCEHPRRWGRSDRGSRLASALRSLQKQTCPSGRRSRSQASSPDVWSAVLTSAPLPRGGLSTESGTCRSSAGDRLARLLATTGGKTAALLVRIRLMNVVVVAFSRRRVSLL
jgi:hypothetical protein